MRRLPSAPSRKTAEPTIALINIVFLMLIFFLVAARVAPPLERGLDLVETGQLEGDAPPDTLVILPDGRTRFRDADLSPEAYVDALRQEDRSTDAIRLVPDRNLSAIGLIEIGNRLKAAGVRRILIVTERSLDLRP